MEIQEVLENLCYYDERNPDNSLQYFDLEGEEPPEPRKDCACDNCFYGRDKLALEILSLKAKQPNQKENRK